jgi:secreted Zn-dependent insulinase-like peptidase
MSLQQILKLFWVIKKQPHGITKKDLDYFIEVIGNNK